MTDRPLQPESHAGSERRGRLYVDREVQASLVRRIVMHWMLFILVTFGLVGLLQGCIEHPGASLGETIRYVLGRNFLGIVAGFALIPIFVYDTIQATHRFAGPIARLRGMLRSMANGERAAELSLRKDDFWKDLASEFNQAIEALRGRRVTKGN